MCQNALARGGIACVQEKHLKAALNVGRKGADLRKLFLEVLELVSLHHRAASAASAELSLPLRTRDKKYTRPHAQGAHREGEGKRARASESEGESERHRHTETATQETRA